MLRLVLGESMRTALGGLVAGVLGALAFGRLISGLLYDLRSTDPLTFAACLGVLSLVALVASLVPGLRATRVDPMVALRDE